MINNNAFSNVLTYCQLANKYNFEPSHFSLEKKKKKICHYRNNIIECTKIKSIVHIYEKRKNLNIPHIIGRLSY